MMFEACWELLQRADVQLMFLVNVTLRNPLFDHLMPVFDYDVSWRVPLLLGWLAAMIFGGRRARLVGLGALALLCITDPVSSRLIKPLAARIRPCNVLAGIHMWRGGGWFVIPDPVVEIYRGSYSMPSSHAANTGAQALWWGWAYPRTRHVWLAIAFLIGYSRIYDGMHWPGDVLVGWIVAALSFWLVWTVAGRLIPAVKPAPRPPSTDDGKREG